MRSTNKNRIRMMKEAIHKAVKEDLTERQRELIIMYYLEGKTMPEIADELKINKSTVSRTINRAVNRIKKSKDIKKILKNT